MTLVSRAAVMFLFLGGEYLGRSCLAFLAPALTTPSARSLLAAPQTRCSNELLASPLARQRGDNDSSSSSSSRGSSGSRLAAQCSTGGRCGPWSSSALAAAAGGSGKPAGASVDIFDALQAGDMASVAEYVQAGGDCNVQDAIGDTPLMLAVESESAPAVRILIKEGGADANRASATTGETPLMLAAYYGYSNIARVLITEGGADLESRNKKGDTALGLACFWGNEETVGCGYLLEAGADPDVRNEAGKRPGDSFDAVFVPAVYESSATAAAESSQEGRGVEEKEEEEDVMFDGDDDDEEEDIMFDDLEEAGGGESAGEENAVASGDVSDVAAGVDGGQEKAHAEPLGPREAIISMLEKARAEAAVA